MDLIPSSEATLSDLILHGHGIKARTHVATVGARGTTFPMALWFLDLSGCLVGTYVISQWVWVLAIV